MTYSRQVEVKVLHLATVRQHYNQGLRSVARLIESFEMQIEQLALSRNLDFHTVCLESTIEFQKSEIVRLKTTLENKSQRLLDSQRLNLQLRKELKLQKVEDERQQAKADRFKDRWQHKFDKLQSRFAEAEQTNQKLLARIRELEKCLESNTTTTLPPKLDSHNSSLPPSLDPPWSKPKRTRSLRTRSGLKVGGQSGHKGNTLRQVADPDSVIVHRVDVCIYCQNSLIPVESRRYHKRQIFEIENGRRSAIEHRIEIKSCWVCHQTTKGQFPDYIKAPVQYGASVFSRIVYLNQYQLLPVARTAESMKDLFECPVSLATIQRAAKVCSHKLMRYEYRLKAAVRQSEVIGVDETGIRINGKVAWVHLARTDGLTHLAVHSKRGRIAFDEIGIINRFTGVLVRDGYLPYQKYEQCEHSLCNAHLLRNLTFVAENESAHKEWTEALAKLLLQIKEAVKQAKLNLQSKLTSHQQNLYFARYDNILRQAEQAVRGSPKRTDVHLSAHNLYRRFTINKPAILRFMTDFRVPFDNNGSERDLRMLKLQQKISGCFRSAASAAVFCRVRSYLSSARKQGRSLLNALEFGLNNQPVG